MYTGNIAYSLLVSFTTKLSPVITFVVYLVASFFNLSLVEFNALSDASFNDTSPSSSYFSA